jgi:hypothetical protein
MRATTGDVGSQQRRNVVGDLPTRIALATTDAVIDRQAVADTGKPLSARDYAKAATVAVLRKLAEIPPNAPASAVAVDFNALAEKMQATHG